MATFSFKVNFYKAASRKIIYFNVIVYYVNQIDFQNCGVQRMLLARY